MTGQCRDYFCQYFKYPAFHMLQLTRWYIACRTLIEARGKALDAAYEDAEAALRAILEQRTFWSRASGKTGTGASERSVWLSWCS